MNNSPFGDEAYFYFRTRIEVRVVYAYDWGAPFESR